MTYTMALLDVSVTCFQEIQERLAAAGYEHAFHNDGSGLVLDMHGIGLRITPEPRDLFGELTPVESSNLTAVGWYDGRLRVQFKSGTLCEYDNVTRALFDELLAAESKGSWFARVIRKDVARFPWRQISRS